LRVFIDFRARMPGLAGWLAGWLPGCQNDAQDFGLDFSIDRCYESDDFMSDELRVYFWGSFWHRVRRFGLWVPLSSNPGAKNFNILGFL